MFFRKKTQIDKTEIALEYLHQSVLEAFDYVRYPENVPTPEILQKLEVREAAHSLDLIHYCLMQRE